MEDKRKHQNAAQIQQILQKGYHTDASQEMNLAQNARWESSTIRQAEYRMYFAWHTEDDLFESKL
jgi:hypothetical protein